jgi:SnoaL-like domain
VLGFRASETAELLGMTKEAVTSALKRARATVDGARASDRPPPSPRGPEEQALTDRFVAAFTEGDVDELIALMTDDIWVRMPPLPFEYRGKEAVRRFFSAIEAHRRNIARMEPIRANRLPGWGEYARDPATGGLHLTGILVIDLADDRICEVAHFETTVASYFGLPRTLDQGISGAIL